MTLTFSRRVVPLADMQHKLVKRICGQVEPPAYQKISGLTFGTLTAADKIKARASWQTKDIISSLVVICLIVAAYMYFMG